MLTSRVRIELSLIFSSLFIAFGIWLIAKQGELDSERVLAAIKIENQADNLVIDSMSLSNIPVIVQFPVNEGNRIVPKNFTVPIDLSSLVSADPTDWTSADEVKSLIYKIESKSVRIDGSLPPTVQVVAVADPAEVALKVRLLARYAKVDVVTSGSLPGYLELSGPSLPDPAQVSVTGSQKALDGLGSKSIQTTPVNLAEVNGSMQVFPKLQLPEGIKLIGRESDRITVDIGVNEKAVSQTLEGVPVSLLAFSESLTAHYDPQTVNVTLQGPRSALDAVKADDLAFSTTRALDEVPNSPQQVGLEARLKDSVPANIALKIKVMEISPPRITVEFKPVLQEHVGVKRP